MYDYVVVGAGLYGSVFAREMTDAGKNCIVIDRRRHIGGNIYTECIEDIEVHVYGAHIFHTNDKRVWDYVCRFAEFNRFINAPIANYKGEIYNLPFNMNTFNKLWGVTKPNEAMNIINNQRNITINPTNLKEQAIYLVGEDIYEKLIKGYTEKQWGKPCTDLPTFIIKRLPVRFTYDNSYFDDKYQGVPENGYTSMIERILDGITVRLNTCFKKGEIPATKIIYTGMIDEYFDYCYGPLEYRSLIFENEVINTSNYQGNAVVNYTDAETPFTRIIEHKHFTHGTQAKTVITREYPSQLRTGTEPYYPVNDEKNNTLYRRYKMLADNEKNVIFGGRLGSYKYYDMWQVIKNALKTAEKELNT